MRKNIFICIIFAVSISACTEELDKEINIETNSSLYDLSESEALTIAKTFHESVTSEPQTRDNNTAFGVKSTYRLHASEKTRALSSEELPLVYEIEINNGLENGRIIVSGDKRFQEVLAYMPSFNDSLYQVSFSLLDIIWLTCSIGFILAVQGLLVLKFIPLFHQHLPALVFINNPGRCHHKQHTTD